MITRNRNGYTPEERERILRAYHERSSLRRLTRTFRVARNTVSTWLKKVPDAARVANHTGVLSG